jgi:hypothetical protein
MIGKVQVTSTGYDPANGKDVQDPTLGPLVDKEGRRVYKTYQPTGSGVGLFVHRLGVTRGGLALPDNANDPGTTLTATVVCVGPECKWVKEGDVVLVSDRLFASPVTHGGSGLVMHVVEEKSLTGISLVEGARANGVSQT